MTTVCQNADRYKPPFWMKQFDYYPRTGELADGPWQDGDGD